MSKTRRIFARIPSPRDQRDDDHLLRKVRSERVSRYWSLGKLHLDQGATPHCVGFASAHALYATPIRRFADPHGIYKGCKLIDGFPDEKGTYVRAAARILKAAGAIEAYKWARTVDAVVTHLLESGPMIVGTDWYEGMRAGGVIEPTGYVLGGHAYLLRGVNRKTGLLRVRNSWGREWGDDGEADLPVDALKVLFENDGEFLLAKEAKPEAKWLR